jgi:ureidoacrylate peracid hydrolase
MTERLERIDTLLAPITFPLDPSLTGLLVIDMQNGFAAPEGTIGAAGFDISMTRAIIPKIQCLVDAAHNAGVHVFWSRQVHYPDDRTRRQHVIPAHLVRSSVGRLCARGTWDAEIVDELQPFIDPEDDVFEKHRASCFYSSNLEARLRIHGIRLLIIAGTTSSFCVDSTIREAYARDYDVIVPGDAISDTEIEATRAVLRSTERFHGFVTTTDEIVEALGAATALTSQERKPLARAD